MPYMKYVDAACLRCLLFDRIEYLVPAIALSVKQDSNLLPKSSRFSRDRAATREFFESPHSGDHAIELLFCLLEAGFLFDIRDDLVKVMDSPW